MIKVANMDSWSDSECIDPQIPENASNNFSLVGCNGLARPLAGEYVRPRLHLISVQCPHPLGAMVSTDEPLLMLVFLSP